MLKVNTAVNNLSRYFCGRKYESIWDIFDHIYCIHYLPYKERLPKIKSELDRIGILNLPQFEFYYTTPCKYYDFVFYDKEFVQKMDTDVNITNINYTVNSFNLLSICMQQDYNRVLIIEDDVSFLKNLNEIKSFILKYPIDYDIVNFEYYIDKGLDISKYKGKVGYIRYTKELIYDTGCISFSKRAIKHIIQMDKQFLRPFDGYCRQQINEEHNVLKRCISAKPLCVQNLYSNRQDKYLSGKKYTNFNLKEYKNV